MMVTLPHAFKKSGLFLIVFIYLFWKDLYNNFSFYKDEKIKQEMEKERPDEMEMAEKEN